MTELSTSQFFPSEKKNKQIQCTFHSVSKIHKTFQEMMKSKSCRLCCVKNLQTSFIKVFKNCQVEDQRIHQNR